MATRTLPFDVNNTLGASFIGMALVCIFYGILVTQTFAYYMRYPSDRPMLKILVAVVCALQTFHQLLLGSGIYYYVITLYNMPLDIFTKPIKWMLIVQLIVGASLGGIVNCCFALRVFRFSKHNWFISGTLLLLVVGQMVLAIVFSWQGFHLKSLAYMGDLKRIGSLALGAGALTDILTAAALCYYLRKIRTGFKETNSLINTLMIYAVNTGLVTSTVSLSAVIIYNILPRTFVYMPFHFVLSTLYANSLLATLNSRSILRGRGTDREAGSNNTNNGNSLYLIPRLPIVPLPVTDQLEPQSKMGIQVDVVLDINRDAMPTPGASWRDKE